MTNDNTFTLNGVLYHKYSRQWTSTKNGGSSGEHHYFVIEESETVPRKVKDKEGKWIEGTYTEHNLITVKLGRGINPDDFTITDPLDIKGKMRGVEYEKKDGTGKGYFTDLEVMTIKFGDLDKDGKRPTEKRKVGQVEDFPPPVDDEEDDGLPF